MTLSSEECRLLTQEIGHIRTSVDDIKVKLDINYVSKAEFWPVAKIAYGIVGVMGLTLLAAMIKMVMK
jgi:hypothetical protein